MKFRPLSPILASALLAQTGYALTTGDIAFTGFNADGNDNLAFVALAPIPAGTEIHFTDNEWTGTALNTGEGSFTWTSAADITAGTIITLNSLDTSASRASNLGSFSANSGSFNLAASNDAVFAYVGTSAAPTAFLAMIANEDAAGVGFDLAGTNLSEAAGTAIIFTEDEDGMAYRGPRSSQAAFSGHLLKIGDRANHWSVEVSDGNLLQPFATTRFHTFSTQLIPTEINSNATGADFWELTNVGDTAVSIGNWKWDDDSRNSADAAAVTIPAGTTLAAGASLIFTPVADSVFRNLWGALPGVQIISGGPGFGQNDAVTLFNDSGAEVFFFSYATAGFTHPDSASVSAGFTRADGSGSAGGHAGPSALAGADARQSAVLDPGFGVTNRRYTGATTGLHGAYVSTSGGLNIGSPGATGLSTGGPSITLTLNSTLSVFAENAANPAATGTVTRAVATASDLVVNLASSDTTEASVPATVTILANQTSAEFPITAVDDSFPDGNKLVTLTATAPGATTPTFEITVQDDADVQDTSFMLTEVHSSPSSGSPSNSEDYWELTNNGSVTRDIGGYSWHDSGRSGAAAAAYKLPAGTLIGPGESVIFTAMPPADFRAWWNLPGTVKVFQSTGAPGLGKGDGISFFDAGQNELFFFSYAVGGFTLENNSPSVSENPLNPTDVTDPGHAGIAAGGTAESQAAIWVPSSGTVSPRYTAATGSNYGSYTAAVGTDTGSPGVTLGVPSVSIVSASISEGNSGTSILALDVTRSEVANAFSVDYAVTGGTADASDYTLASGTLTFPAGGATSLPVNIIVNGDTDSEPDETVIVTLSNLVNTVGTTILGSAEGTGTILTDDTISPQITIQPASTTITSGGTTTLTIAATGSPAPTIQWYQGNRGDTSTPVGTNSNSFVTPSLTTSTSYWARVSNLGASVDSDTATVTIVAGTTGVDLSTYVRVGRYNLPEPTRTALPPGTAAHNLLCQEASAVTYNWDTDTLFISCDGGRSITQVSKTGQLIDTMSLDLQAGAPQGTAFYDPEGITYLGGGQFVISEERDRQLVKFTYQAGTTLTRANSQTVDLGTFDDNTGTEGLSWDPLTNGFIVLKEKTPIGVFQTGVDFAAGTATNGSSSTVNSNNLFDTTLLGMTDVADVFALSNLPSLASLPQEANLLVLGQENARVVNISRTGAILSTLNIAAEAGDTISVADMQHEGITMDRAGNVYIVNENGGGNINYPQLWVYSASIATNQPPTAVTLNNPLNSIEENSSTASPVKVGDIVVTDDGLGTNAISLTGADAASFEITGSALYLKAGVTLDFETKASYSVTVSVDDTAVGVTPDVTANFTLTVTDQAVETPAAAALVITEVAPWSSGNSPGVAADWFEVTNVSDNPVTITGWKIDDSNPTFATGAFLNGITTIAPGESVIFIETNDLPGKTPAFINSWFGGNAPAGLQIGSYFGSGGLSTGGDEVNLFNAAGVLQSNVTFAAADGISPYQTFDNTQALNLTAISLLSEVGVNGAFVAANSAGEIGSPGYSAPGVLRITEVAPWSSGNSPVAADWFEVTNTGARAVDITGWKVDDGSESPAAALFLNGITRIAPGESVIFLETADLAGKATLFKSTWFGANPPANLQIGSYSGQGIGLSTGGDAVNLYDTTSPTPVRRVNVSFGIAPSSAPFASFDNTAALNVATVTLKSVPGVNGAFIAANDPNEVGSPGSVVGSGPQDFALWLAGKGYTSFGFGTDSDNDGLTDGVEFFFNQNPNLGGDFGNLPNLVPNGGALELDFTRLTDTGSATGELVVSNDLNTWTPALLGVDYTVASSVVSGDETAFTFALPGTGPSAPGVSPVYLLPNDSNPVGASLGGVRVVNEGLVGVGRLSGNSLDRFGETQGAASGLFITDWAYASGQFSGTFQVLPDRGHGDGTSNYAARLHEVDFTFTPYYGEVAASAQNQVVPTYATSTKFTYQDGATEKFTTGLNPTGTSSLFGQTVGTVTAANGPGGSQESLLSMDAEAIHLFEDGSGFISDEYGTYIARFNSAKKITGLTQLPGAAQPYKANVLNFDSFAAPATGRRNNQGLEGMSVTPDGTRLFALLQSATVQDTNGSQQQTRNNARLFVYDIAGANRENPVVVGEYVVKLPQIDLNSNGSGADGTAAQSEIVALGHNSFLMLPRDGNGLGKLNSAPILFKSVQLVDFASATNILGQYDGVGQQITVTPGVLRPEIQAAASAEIINMLQQDDLTKFGLNTTLPANADTLNEKIEGMSLVPDLSTPAANDFFLFVANDNDFQSSNVMMLDAAGNVTSKGPGQVGGVTNDAMFYVWRLTIDAGGKKFFRFGIK